MDTSVPPLRSPRGRRRHEGSAETWADRRTNITVQLDPALKADLERLKEHYGQFELAPVIRMAIRHLLRTTFPEPQEP